MRPLIFTQNVTADGSIEMLDDWFDPMAQDADQAQIVARDSASCDAILLGRQTFEDFRGFWPHQTDDATGITDYLNTVDKYVVSSTMTDPEWQNSTVLSGDVIDEVTALKNADGKDIVVTGSISLCHTLIGAGLVDEYRLFVYPTVQGSGRRLFPDGLEIPTLRLVDTKSFELGVSLLRYRTV